MAKTRLTAEEVDRIVSMLTSWTGPLSWEHVCQRVQAVLKRPFTRQGLDKQESIRIAFQQAKTRLRRSKSMPHSPPNSETPPELAVAQRRIDNLLAEIKVLEKEKNLFLERFATWLYNARSRGMSEQDLNLPLPVIDRRKSEK